MNASPVRRAQTLPIRLLCAGLDTSLLHRLADAVNFFGCWLDAVATFDAAHERLATNGYDAVLLGYTHPDTSLRAFLANLRAPGSRDRGLPVLAVADVRDFEAASGLVGYGLTRVLDRDRAPLLLHVVLREVLDVAPRIPVEAEVRLGPAARLSGLRLAYSGGPSVCRTINLSRSGMLVATARQDPPGTVLPFELTVPDEGAPLRGWAEVARVAGDAPADGPGLGLRIRTFSLDGVNKYNAYLERLGA